jgi:hypothetical protein
LSFVQLVAVIPAKAGYPVRRSFSAQARAALGYWISRLRG